MSVSTRWFNSLISWSTRIVFTAPFLHLRHSAYQHIKHYLLFYVFDRLFRWQGHWCTRGASSQEKEVLSDSESTPNSKWNGLWDSHWPVNSSWDRQLTVEEFCSVTAKSLALCSRPAEVKCFRWLTVLVSMKIHQSTRTKKLWPSPLPQLLWKTIFLYI